MHCTSRAYFFFFPWNPRGKNFQEGKKLHIVKYAKEVKKQGKNAAAYAAERPILQKTFLKLKIRGFKSRAAYDGVRMVFRNNFVKL